MSLGPVDWPAIAADLDASGCALTLVFGDA
jgi:hypothetical protein